MKRNLKKVISTVLALSLSLSSFMALGTASSAATFTDVADTASYSEAVEALAAIGAISGYEDGTFKPNDNITRAEAVTMIVAAVNMTEDAKNSGSTTQFADVNANAAWAAGYVNVGVAQGFISGMTATEFAPSENVTYAQVLSILTRILGYGEFAEGRGGWPNGYLTAASTAGILSGVSAGANDAVTRAQVAQLIWNAVQAPMLDITEFSTSLTDTKMAKMDGNDGRDFKTVLSDKFDAYVLNITVTGNSRGGTGNAGEITMEITGTNDYDPDLESLTKNIKDYDGRKTKVNVGNTPAEDYLWNSAKVIAEFNDDDEWTLLYFAPTSKINTQVVDGTLIAENDGSDKEKGIEYGEKDGKLRIKKTASSSTTTNYTITNDAKLFVNGVEYKDIKGNETVVRNLIANSTGDTTLVEATGTDAKSNTYDKVMINYYITASVTQVTSKSGSTKVQLSSVKNNDLNSGTSFEITDDDIADGTKTVSVVKAGAAAELTSLVRDDVVSVKYNINSTMDASAFIEIIATDETITGKYTGYDDEDEVYTVAGEDYKAVDKDLLAEDLTVGSTYTFRLDSFGKLFAFDEEATSKNYAIVESYVDISSSTTSSSDASYIRVMTLDGQSKTIYIDSSYEATARTILNGMNIGTNSSNTVVTNGVAMKDRIVEYSVKNSNGRINKLAKVTDIEVFTDAEYKEASNKLGKTLAATATVLDATDYDLDSPNVSDYKASSLAGLGDGVSYDGILVYKNSNAEYAYVIITKAGNIFNASSEVVIAAADASTNSQTQVEGEDVYSLYVMQNGNDSAEQLYISQSVVVYNGDETAKLTDVTRGSAFLYTTDSDGFVDEINIIFKAPADFNKLLQASDATKYVSLPRTANIAADDWIIDLSDKNFTSDADEEIQLVLGAVTKSTTSTAYVSPIVKVAGADETKDKYYADTDKAETYTISSNSKIYAFDMDGTTGRSAFSGGSFSAVINSRDTDDGKAWLYGLTAEDAAKDIIDHGDAVQIVFAVVVDGIVHTALVMDN